MSRTTRFAALAAVAIAIKLLWPAAKGAEFSTTATVTRASGVGIAPGAACAVQVRNQSRGGFACRVTVTCDGVALFGGRIPGGYARCTARDGRWVRAEDPDVASRDGDPAIDVDMQRGTLIFRTERARVEAIVQRPQ